MRRFSRLALLVGIAFSAHGARSQTYVEINPSSSQTVNQPTGTTFSVNQFQATTSANLFGNVGIGTSAPDRNLVIYGSNPALGFINTTSNNERSFLSTYDRLMQFAFNRDPLIGTVFDNTKSYGFFNIGSGPTDASPALFDIVLSNGPGGALSNIFHASGNGNVGIGTTEPTSRLEVNGSITLSSNSAGTIVFPDNSIQHTAFSGTQDTLRVSNSSGQGGPGYLGYVDHTTQLAYNRLPLDASIPNSQDSAAYMNLTGSSGPSRLDLVLQAGPGLGWHNVFNASGNGNLSLGELNSGGTIYVNDQLVLPANSNASIKFPNNTVQSVAWDGTTLGGDYSEAIDVIGEKSNYEPGDVLVIASDVSGKFTKSVEPYSHMVAGVYSTKPGLLGRRTTAPRPSELDEVPLAMLGIVPVKVTAENGSISRGDLLVSSSIPGLAMKGTDPKRLSGAIIGKALSPLKSGIGVVEVLLVIQ